MDPNKLLQWATLELGFRDDRHKNDEWLSKVCHEDLLPVWNFLVKNVKSKRNAKKIRANLKLYGLQCSEPKANIKDLYPGQKPDLSTGLNEEATDLEKDVQEWLDYISRNDSYMKKLDDKLSEVQQQDAAIHIFSKELNHMSNTYQDLQQRLHLIKETFTSRPASSTMYFHREDKESSIQWEPACIRDVREVCEAIARKKKEYVADGSASNRSMDHRVLLEDSQWTSVERISSSYPPKEILTSLNDCTNKTTRMVLDKTSSISLVEDAHHLKFKFESGGLKDVSPERPLLKTVFELIEERQKAHFARFIRSQENRNAIMKLSMKVREKLDQLDCILAEKIGHNEHAVKVMRNVCRKRIRLCGIKASSTFIHKKISQLRELAASKQDSVDKIYAKYKRIQKFENLMGSKQLVIQSLVKHNNSAKGNLEGHCTEITQFISKNIQENIQALREHIMNSNGILLKEVETFKNLPMSRLNWFMLPSSQLQPSQKLSIHRLAYFDSLPGRECLSFIMKTFEADENKSPESLLLKILEHVQKEFETAEDRRETQTLKTQVEDTYQMLCKDLEKDQSNKHDTPSSSLLTKLEEAREKSTAIKDETDEVKRALKIWWQQPAQFTVPWICLDGSNLEEWTNKWTMNAAMLRKYELQSTH